MKKIKIGVVEDDSNWRRILKDYLEDSNYVVSFAVSSSQELFYRLQYHGPFLDLITLDLQLLETGGRDFEGAIIIKFLFREYPNIKILIVTGFEMEARMLKLGAHAVISKGDFTRLEFINVVNALVSIAPVPRHLRRKIDYLPDDPTE